MGTFADLVKQKQKDWECTDLIADSHKHKTKKIPFSSPLMSWCTYGGIPRGRITEFFGDPGGGKSTTALDLCKNANILFKSEYEDRVIVLRQLICDGNKAADSELDELLEIGPNKVLYIDLENTYDYEWSAKLGLENDDVIVMQPPNIIAEDILDAVLEFIETGEIGFIIIDSIPALIPKSVLDKKLHEKTVASLAGIMTTFCTKVTPLLTRYDCTLLLINQIRDNLNNPYSPNTPGGRAIKFFASLRIWFRQGSPVNFLGEEVPQKTEDPAGYLINATIVKHKAGPNDRKQGTYFLMCQTGIRPDFDFAQLAIKKYGIIQKKGAWFTICDPMTGEVITDPSTDKPIKINGLAKVYDYLATNFEYYNSLKTYITNDINGVSEEINDESKPD